MTSSNGQLCQVFVCCTPQSALLVPTDRAHVFCILAAPRDLALAVRQHRCTDKLRPVSA